MAFFQGHVQKAFESRETLKLFLKALKIFFLKNLPGRTKVDVTQQGEQSWCLLQVDFSLELESIGCIGVERDPFLMVPPSHQNGSPSAGIGES